MGLEMFRRLADHAAARGDGVAVRVIGDQAEAFEPLTWRQLWADVRVAAQRLDADSRLAADATVMLLCPNRPELLPAFLAVLATGRRLMPVDPTLTPHELGLLADRADVDLILADAGLRQTMADLPRPTLDLDELVGGGVADGEAVASAFTDRGEQGWLLLQSSGTTGGPKIVQRNGRSLDAVARNVAEAVGLRRADRVMAAVPLSHSYGIENGLLAPLWAGATALHHVRGVGPIGRGFDPQVILRGGATVLPGVPSMFEMIDRLGLDGGDLRLAYSAGASLPAELAQRLEQRTGLRLGQLYGSTEIGSVTYGPDPAGVGRPMQGVDVRILDPDRANPDDPLPTDAAGHVAVKAPSMFAGYLDPTPASDATVVDGFFLTGDLGRVDEDGQLFITGRLKLLIDVGGVKVNPLEVEQAIVAYPGIAECVVVPDPVSPTVNRVKAIVQVDEDEAGFDESQLRRFLRSRLAGHKIPRTFERRAALPKSPTGKVLRQQLLNERVPA